jgi:predicted O-methyltransferase YrrM
MADWDYYQRLQTELTRPWVSGIPANLRNQDRLLPDQPVMRHLYQGADYYADLAEVVNSVLPIFSVHDKFDIRLKPGMTYETLGSDLATLHFLQLLVRLTGARDVLEVGTYVGVSAMFLAEAVGEGGHVVTVEVGEEFYTLARDNIARNGLAHRILVVGGDILEIATGEADYDLIFLDGGKADYDKILPAMLDMLRPGGLLVVDDVFCNGDTLNDMPTTAKGGGVGAMLKRAARRGLKEYSPVILPCGNGLLLMCKPKLRTA